VQRLITTLSLHLLLLVQACLPTCLVVWVAWEDWGVWGELPEHQVSNLRRRSVWYMQQHHRHRGSTLLNKWCMCAGSHRPCPTGNTCQHVCSYTVLSKRPVTVPTCIGPTVISAAVAPLLFTEEPVVRVMQVA
jgi:hypothetical protein